MNIGTDVAQEADPNATKLTPPDPSRSVRVGSDVLYALDCGPHKGTLRPAKVVQVWSQTCVNLAVFTDGSNDGLDPVHRVTSAVYGQGYNTWTWAEGPSIPA